MIDGMWVMYGDEEYDRLFSEISNFYSFVVRCNDLNDLRYQMLSTNTKKVILIYQKYNKAIKELINIILKINAKAIIIGVTDVKDKDSKRKQLDEGISNFIDLNQSYDNIFKELKGYNKIFDYKNEVNIIYSKDKRISLNIDTNECKVNDYLIKLTKSEFIFLRRLMVNKGLVISRKDMYFSLHEYKKNVVDEARLNNYRSLDNIASALKKKIGDKYIKTFYRGGYSWGE